MRGARDPEADTVTRSFDSPWKDALDEYLEPFLAYFLPDVHALIDWTRGYEPLDAELAEIVREAELGPSAADRLFRVYTRDGSDAWVLIHVEVQSQRDRDFARRMFAYYYRLRDRYGRPVASVAVLGDAGVKWRPSAFVERFAGCAVRYKFRTVKLWDWRDRIGELEALPQPVGAVVAAHLESLKTHGAPSDRREAKWRLIRGLYDRGLTPEQVRKAIRLVDWLLELPKDLDRQLKIELHNYEREQGMPYVTSFERLGREEGLEEGERLGLRRAVELGLELKFGSAPPDIMTKVAAVDDLERLRALPGAIKSSATLDEFLAHVR